MSAPPTVLLIFGTSHVGKSTLAAQIGDTLGWQVQSTDGMGRHPGRPWPEVKPQVAEFYANLSDDTIYWFLRAHHENMWPLIRDRILEGISLGEGLVIEGSALRPDFLAELTQPEIRRIGLFAESTFLRQRIETESGYQHRDDTARAHIDRFIARSLMDNHQLVEASRNLGLPLLNVSDEAQLAAWTADFLKASGRGKAQG